MASALMAWVWIGLSLARLNIAEIQRYAHGRVTGRAELRDGNERTSDADPERWTGRSFPAPVWHFLQGTNLLLASVLLFFPPHPSKTAIQTFSISYGLCFFFHPHSHKVEMAGKLGALEAPRQWSLLSCTLKILCGF